MLCVVYNINKLGFLPHNFLLVQMTCLLLYTISDIISSFNDKIIKSILKSTYLLTPSPLPYSILYLDTTKTYRYKFS